MPRPDFSLARAWRGQEARRMPSNIAKGKVMNKDQVKGTVKEAAGKVQQKAGKLLGSPEQEAKGLTKKLQGKAQKKVGDAKEALADARARR